MAKQKDEITVEECLEALEHMQEQMRVILPFVPDHLSSQIIMPEIEFKRSLPRSQHKRKRIESIEMADLENDPILKNSQLFLENFKSGAIKRELNKYKNMKKVPPPCKPIRFHSFKIPPFPQITEPNILKEEPPKVISRPKNVFTTKEDAECFLMFTISQVLQLFSQIANAFKLDAAKRRNYPLTGSSQNKYVAECCMQTMRELQTLANGPVNKLLKELTENFTSALPEHSDNLKETDELNYVTSCSYWNTDCISTESNERESAPGDGC